MQYKAAIVSLLLVFLMSTAGISSTMAQSECSPTGEEIQTTFFNDTHTDVTVHWVDYGCVEQDGTPIPAGESLQFTTYVGHEFVFRDPAGEQLIYIGVNELSADSTLSLKQTISEGASASVMWTTFNPEREALGYEPMYFSDMLYLMAEQAVTDFEEAQLAAGVDVDAIMDGADYTPIFDLLNAAASENEAGFVLASIGNVGGELSSVEEVEARIIADYEESGADGQWMSESNQSFAVYADEHIFIFVFSDLSQPELDSRLGADVDESGSDVVTSSSLGTVQTGVLAADSATNEYDLSVEEGNYYAVVLASAEFDTYLTVVDESGAVIGENDDFIETHSVVAFTAASSGTYTVIVDSFLDGASGEYKLGIGEADFAELNFLTDTNTTSNLSLNVENGVTYFVAVSSEEFDTYLNIYDEAGSVIESNDDYDGTNSFIVFTASADGIFSVEVTSFDGTSTGNYTLLMGSMAE